MLASSVYGLSVQSLLEWPRVTGVLLAVLQLGKSLKSVSWSNNGNRTALFPSPVLEVIFCLSVVVFVSVDLGGNANLGPVTQKKSSGDCFLIV